MFRKFLFSLFVISNILQIFNCCEGHQKLLGKSLPQGNDELKEENGEEEIRKMLHELKANLEHGQWIENPEQLVAAVLRSACEQFNIFENKNKKLEKTPAEGDRRFLHFSPETELRGKMQEFCDESDWNKLSDIEEMIEEMHALIRKNGRKMVQKQSEKEKIERIIPMKSVEVKNVDEILKILGLIEAKMGQGSAKRVLKKALKRSNLLMRPSGLMELVMDLWKATIDMMATNGGQQRDDQKQVRAVHAAAPQGHSPTMPVAVRVHRRRRRFDYKFSLDDGVLLLLAWIFVYCSVLLGDAFINLMDESNIFYGCVVFGVYVIFAMLRAGKLKW